MSLTVHIRHYVNICIDFIVKYLSQNTRPQSQLSSKASWSVFLLQSFFFISLVACLSGLCKLEVNGSGERFLQKQSHNVELENSKQHYHGNIFS